MKQKDSRSNGFTQRRARRTRPTNGGFTLLELLTVIAIIAVLAGLLFPTIKTAMIRAEVAKAQQGVNGLATAFKAYYTEYGKYPVTTAPPVPPGEILVSTKMYGLLKGEDVSGDVTGGTDQNSTLIHYNGNPRQIRFLEFKANDLSVTGPYVTNYVDSWGITYRCLFDVAYANYVQNPFMQSGSPQNIVNAGVLVWSDGPDAQEAINNVNGENAPPNKDNIMSWH